MDELFGNQSINYVRNYVDVSITSLAVFRSSERLKEILNSAPVPERLSLRFELVSKLVIELMVLPELDSFLGSESSLHQIGHDKTLDDLRASLVSDLVHLRLSPMVPAVLTISEYAPTLLCLMSCHLLHVSAVSYEISTAVSAVVAAIRSDVCDSNISSSSDDNLALIIRRHAMSHFNWLRSGLDRLLRAGRDVHVLSGLNATLRAWMKGEEYESPQHLLSVFRQRYRDSLRQMPLPLHSLRWEDILQGIKDLKRESLKVDMPPEYSNYNSSCSSTSEESVLFPLVRAVECLLCQEPGSIQLNEVLDSLAPVKVEESESPSRMSVMAAVGLDVPGGSGSPCSAASAASVLVGYALLGASRTLCGGDALVIVGDLYGAEGLTLRPLAEAPGSRPGLQSGGGVILRVSSLPSACTNSPIRLQLSLSLTQYFSLGKAGGSDQEVVMRFRTVVTTQVRAIKPLTADVAMTEDTEDVLMSRRWSCKRNLMIEPI